MILGPRPTPARWPWPAEVPPPRPPSRPFGPEWGDPPYRWPDELWRVPLRWQEILWAAPVQHKTATITSGSGSTSITFNSAVTIGNRVIVAVGIFPQGTTVSNVTDNATTPNSYHADGSISDAGSGDTADVHSANCALNPSSGNLKVTVTFTGSTLSGGDIYITEWAGISTALNAVDASGTGTASGTATFAAQTSGNCSATGEVVYAIAVQSVGGTEGVGSGSTLIDSNGSNGDETGYQTAGSTSGSKGVVNFTTTGTSQSWAGVCIAYALAASANPFKNPASFAVTGGRGGRLVARKRTGFLYGTADQAGAAITLTSTPPTMPADFGVAPGRGRAARRRDGRWTTASGTSSTTYQDQVISQTEDRGWGGRLRHWPWTKPRDWSSQGFNPPNPLKVAASWLVQVARGGRGPRRRSGFWQAADQASQQLTGVQLPGVVLADVWGASTHPGRPSRRRDARQTTGSAETATTFQDQVIGVSGEARVIARIRRGAKPAERDAGAWATVYGTLLVNPLKVAAAVLVAVGRRAARRRFGWWWYADQSQAQLTGTQLPGTLPADFGVAGGHGGRSSRRRDARWPTAAGETATTYRDQVVSSTSETRQAGRLRSQRGLPAAAPPSSPSPLKNPVSWLVQVGRRARRRWGNAPPQPSDQAAAQVDLSPTFRSASTWQPSGRRPNRRRDARPLATGGETATTFRDQAIGRGSEARSTARLRQPDRPFPGPLRRLAAPPAAVVYALKLAGRYLLAPTMRYVLTVRARFLGRPWRP